MRQPTSAVHSPAPRRAVVIAAVLAAILAMAVVACGGGATPAPSGRPSATPAAPSPSAPTPTKVPGSDAETPTPAPGTIETPWGTAWDALPAGFPIPPGSRPADPVDPAADPASASFVTELREGDVAKQMQGDLAGAGYSVEALGGPAEDGSLVIDAVGRDAACRVRVTVRPFGGYTLVAILYGAACPWG